MAIIVAGSVNMDIVNRVSRHPVPGETVKSLELIYNPGGKGANQATAAARSGAQVKFVGAVGDDSFGSGLLDSLRRSGVDVSAVSVKQGSSGIAIITVDESGENEIIIAEGANGKVAEADVRETLESLSANDTVLLQNEIAWPINRYVLEEAHRRGARVFMNPAPAFDLPREAYACIDVLVVNETETEAMTGTEVNGVEDAAKAASSLLEAGIGGAAVTLGADGVYYADRNGAAVHVPAYRVTAVDTTGAGDTFIGALAAASPTGRIDEQALRFASAAAALQVTRYGAQSAIPDRGEIERFLSERKGR